MSPLAQALLQFVIYALIIIFAIFAELAIEAWDDDDESYRNAWLLRLFVRWYKFVFRRKNDR